MRLKRATAGPGLLRVAAVGIFVGVVLFVGVLYVVNALGSTYPWINHDVAYFSYLGLEMLDGSRLYVDLKEDNPPAAPLLLAMIVGLSHLLGLPDFVLQHMFVLFLGLAGLAILSYAFPSRDDDTSFVLVALAYLLVVIRGNFSNNLFPAAPDIPYDFGQREHLFSIVFLPYLMLRLRRPAVPLMLAPNLVLVGFFSLFKPFWPPLVVAVELLRTGDRKTRAWGPRFAIAAGMVLPFVLLLLHSPDSFRTFLVDNIPMYLRGGYAHYDANLAEFLSSPLHVQMIAGWLLLLVPGWICFRRGLVEPRVLLLLGFLAAVAYGSVIHQHKFWSYHTMTFFAISIVPGAFLVAAVVESMRSAVSRRTLASVTIGLLLTLTGSTMASTAKMLWRLPPIGHELAPLIAPYGKTMFFSMSVKTSYAPLLLRKPMVGPWTVFLDLPELLAEPDASRRDALLTDFASRVDRVIDEQAPDLLVFSPEGQALYGRSLHDVFVEIGTVPRVRYLRLHEIELLRISERLAGWTVYRRVDPP